MDLQFVLVEKNGNLKEVLFKKFDINTLYKKCGLKKPDDFEKRTTWEKNISGTKYIIELYAKDTGRANTENKYDFPPPVDTNLFFGNCALLAKKSDDKYISLDNDTWEKIYENLFGGFENLSSSAIEDEEEEDELENVSENMKTKTGYLKDDFVVDEDDDDDEDNNDGDDDVDDEDTLDNDSWDSETDNNSVLISDDEEGELFDDLGSELSEECYEYSEE